MKNLHELQNISFICQIVTNILFMSRCRVVQREAYFVVSHDQAIDRQGNLLE